jgi:hypothetical protein
MYLIGVCALAVGLLVAYLEFVPRAPVAEIPLTADAKTYITKLQLNDVGIQAKLDYFGQKVVEISGSIGNGGDRNLGVVEVSVVFRDYAGKILSRQRAPIVSVKMGGLKPGETKPFRLPFDAVPEGWNNQMPQLVIAGIDFQ